MPLKLAPCLKEATREIHLVTVGRPAVGQASQPGLSLADAFRCCQRPIAGDSQPSPQGFGGQWVEPLWFGRDEDQLLVDDSPFSRLKLCISQNPGVSESPQLLEFVRKGRATLLGGYGPVGDPKSMMPRYRFLDRIPNSEHFRGLLLGYYDCVLILGRVDGGFAKTTVLLNRPSDREGNKAIYERTWWLPLHCLN